MYANMAVMTKRKSGDRSKAIGNGWKRCALAISGGPDSVYLLHREIPFDKVLLLHVNHGARGRDSDRDEAFVRDLAKRSGLRLEVKKMHAGHRAGTGVAPGFEESARNVRFRFLKEMKGKHGVDRILLAHTADDQVETILMRFFEGAGIAGLKGIPRETDDGIVRPILDVWKADILAYLKKQKIPYRVDKSNLDTRSERNWVRHVLIPLLVKRYGKTVKKRIFTLGERFRELDGYIDAEAARWIRRNVKSTPKQGGVRKIDGKVPSKQKYPPEEGPGAFALKRDSLSGLPTVLRIRVLQKIGFDRLGIAPNERLLIAMDRFVREGGPSARLKVGNGWELENRYEEARFKPAPGTGSEARAGHQGKRYGGRNPDVLRGPGVYLLPVAGEEAQGMEIVWQERENVSPAQARRLTAKGGAEVFDADSLPLPLAVRPLRAGDRIRPFGLDAEKKVKEILIDRKVPRDERWGRPVLCDAEGTLLWIPGVVRSAHAPVTPRTWKAVLLRLSAAPSRT